MNTIDLICVECGHHDSGAFCSNCKQPLSTDDKDFLEILRWRMSDYGYQNIGMDLKSVNSVSLGLLHGALRGSSVSRQAGVYI